MKNFLAAPYGKWKKLSGYFRAFLILLVVLLAAGLATLGSVRDTGEAYALLRKQSSDLLAPSVVFRLKNPSRTKDDGTTETIGLRIDSVYVNLAVIYGEETVPAKLRLERSTSGETFSSAVDATFANFEDPLPEKEGESAAAADAQDVFFRYVSGFAINTGSAVSTYSYYRLSVFESCPNVLINEVVFVGEEIDNSASSGGTGEYYIIPAYIYEATPTPEESAEAARTRAAALLDGDLNYAPKAVEEGTPLMARKVDATTFGGQSSYSRFSREETASLMTIAEMRRGSEYSADASGESIDVYYADRIYGAFGTDLLALGTLMFGMSPFGLRFFPMLAAFGALVVLSRLLVRLTKSERAGFLFALTFGLSGMFFAYGHLGTPLMLGVFFFVCALDLVHRFYANGIAKANFLHVVPLLAAGIFGGMAMCVNGAFAIPLAGVVALFVCGMVRQSRARKYALEKALAPAETPVEPASEETEPETPAQRAGKVVAEYRFRNTAAPALFALGIIFGTFFFALIGMLPSYFVYLKLFDDPALPKGNVFLFAWKLFAGGFTGTNAYMGENAWNIFRILFRGEGTMYAVSAAVVNPVALLVGAMGVGIAIYRIITLCLQKEHDKKWRAGLRRYAILLGGLLLSMIAALAVKGAAAFVVLFLVFCFLLGATIFGETYPDRYTKALKIAEIVYIVLLAVGFALTAVFVFSIPLPARFLTSLIG